MADRHWAIHWLRRNWFAPLLAVLLAIEIAFARTTYWAGDHLAEAAILFDLCLVVPTLHFLCYRRALPRRTLLIRTAGLALGGLFVASWLVPAAAQQWIDDLDWLRTAGLIVLTLIELRLVIAGLRMVFGGRADAAEISSHTGAPEWVARLMLLEARFWKALWRWLRRR